jgi:N-acyl-D-aspartate/D-glutamate deacylase
VLAGVLGGCVREGMIADITVLDPETIREDSDCAEGKNGLPTTGIPYVVISGQVAVRDSRVDLDVRAGQPIRYTIISE